MISGVVAALIAIAVGAPAPTPEPLPDGAGETGSMLLDIGNLQWWQALLGIVTGLGLSPAPWLLGLALNRIQFTAPARADYAERVSELNTAHAREVDSLNKAHASAVAELVAHHQALSAEKDRAYVEMQTSRDYYREARLEERRRADEALAAVAETAELGKTAIAMLDAFNKAAADLTGEPT